MCLVDVAAEVAADVASRVDCVAIANPDVRAGEASVYM